MFRQGDVLIVPIDRMPSGLQRLARANDSVVLAYGEATGHAHAIRAAGVALFRDPKRDAMFILVAGASPVALEHPEHGTIHIPPGDYRIIRQREYFPDSNRIVED
jgi:hypothetical protein